MSAAASRPPAQPARNRPLLLRYGLVGIASNVGLYLAYLALLALGVGYQLAMTLAYATGVALGYLLHKSWTFRHQGRHVQAALRYGLVYLLGYGLNWVGLWWLVEHVGLHAGLAQAVMVVVVALVLFVAQRNWVFRQGRGSMGSGE